MRFAGFVAGMALLGFAVGCSQSASDGGPKTDTGSQEAVVQEDSPGSSVHRFLEAVRAGNDEKSALMLTAVARKKTAEYDMVVAPPGSDTASFKVGEVEMIGQDGAHVASFWTDVDEHGKQHTDTIIWMVRKETEGWRIAGMATRVFENQPAMILNFEEPEDMLAKQQAMEEEMSLRVGSDGTNASDQKTADVRSQIDRAAPSKRQK